MSEILEVRFQPRSKYEEPKPIPTAGASAIVGPVTLAGEASRDQANAIFRLARELVLPSLALPGADEFWDYWAEHCDQFNSFVDTLCALQNAADVVAGVAKRPLDDLGFQMWESCINAAEHLVANGADVARAAFCDWEAAARIIARFDSRSVLPDDPEDQKLAATHNFALKMFSPFSICLLEAGDVDVEVHPELRSVIVEAVSGTADALYSTACSGARRRGVSDEFDIEWALSIWTEPSSSFARYLEERGPDLITDELRAVCEHQDHLREMVAKLGQGDRIASEQLLEASKRLGPANVVDDDGKWARELATDLAAMRD
jgi:hypothetical protein